MAGFIPRCAAPLGGTFLQPDLADLDRPPAYWHELFGQFRTLGMSQVYVQWLRYGGHSLEPLLAPLAAAAAENGIVLHLGLAFDPDYWRQLNAPDGELARHLAEWRAASLALAERAMAAAPAGWYLPEEIDDVAWASEARGNLLAEHLARSVEGLARLGGGRPVAISTFVGGSGRQQDFLELWRQAWQAADVTVMLQDGQGTHKLPEDRLRPYVEGVAELARRLGRRWAIVVEVFEQISGTPVNEAAFAARPAQMSRILGQIALARQFPGAGRVAFAAREYMLARPAGEASLAEHYRQYYCRW